MIYKMIYCKTRIMKFFCTFLSVILCLLFGCITSKKEKNPAEDAPMNVLFIMADDLNNDLGFYGNTEIYTPNLDKLASEGVFFNRAYSQSPLCGPSRVSLLTSLRPATTNVIVNDTDFRDYVPDAVTLPQLFKNNGYFSGRVGKIFHYGVPGQIGTNGLDDSISWVERYNPIGVDKFEEDSLINLTPHMGLGGALAYHATEETDTAHTDGKVTQSAIQMLEAHKNEPFFIAVGYFRPHVPFIAPQKYFDFYDAETIELRREPPNDRDDIPELAMATTKIPDHGLIPEEQRLAIRGYYACISFVDHQVGILLDALERLGLAENTLVVFMSDHGYNLGEHGMWEKFNLFEESARIPLIFRLPGQKTQVNSTNGIVEMLDIYPTIAELCGLKAPDYLHGSSFVPLLKNPEREWREAAISEVGRWTRRNPLHRDSANWNSKLMGKSIRTGEWRYTEWGDGDFGRELYDHQNDPGEFNNLSNQQKLKPTMQQLKENYFEKMPVLPAP